MGKMRLAVIIFILVWLIRCSNANQPTSDFYNSSDDFFSVDGTSSNLKDFEGKYVFVNIWATWCSPCVVSTPKFARFNDQFDDSQVAFITISVDGTKQEWLEFVNREGIQKHSFWLGEVTTSNWYSLTQEIHDLDGNETTLTTLPQYLLFSKSGELIKKDMSLSTQSGVLQALDSLTVN